jgi:hypothetical protein
VGDHALVAMAKEILLSPSCYLSSDLCTSWRKIAIALIDPVTGVLSAMACFSSIIRFLLSRKHVLTVKWAPRTHANFIDDETAPAICGESAVDLDPNSLPTWSRLLTCKKRFLRWLLLLRRREHRIQKRASRKRPGCPFDF